ncbi:MAG: signal recognition particle protein [Pseudomonadota bacterium]|nr:signal recognition particle protein [Pseudomonadota bacterium]
MFDALSDRLGGILDGLTRRGVLKEQDVDEAMREIRLALLEADVALPVVRDFIGKVKPAALGREVLRSVTPGQLVVKIVHDELVKMLGDDSAAGINLAATAPVPILLVGLQGSGKTTTAAKLGFRFSARDKKKVLMASLDVYRPAAQQQLAVLGEQANIATLPIVNGQQPGDIATRAMQAGRLGGYDVVILDTAGRLHVDEILMDEMAAVSKIAEPHEVLLVADAMTGQDAVNAATSFNDRIGLTGIVLTRVDGDARGGAALSMRSVTGCPIKMMGVGEKLDEFEDFYPERIANRILGMGDVVSLVEKVSETIEAEQAEKLAKKMKKGEMNLDDLADQLDQLQKMGGLGSLMGMLPGVAKAQRQMAEANLDEKSIRRQRAILSSMTADERRRPKVIQASRKRRIASGSGTSVQDVNKLLKQFQMMNKMMKKVGKMGDKGLMRHGIPGLPPGF